MRTLSLAHRERPVCCSNDAHLTMPTGNPALVNSNGSVEWIQMINLYTTCRMDLTLFPFDTQTCPITIAFTGFDSTLVRQQQPLGPS